jgi:hypothetical protein
MIDCMEPAYLGAETTLGTFLQIHLWGSPSVIFFLKHGLRLKQKMEICCIDIAIHHDFVLCQSREGSSDGRFAGSPFATNDG